MSAARASFPLSWPDGFPRVVSYCRRRGTFRIGSLEAENDLREEVTRLGADDLIVSSNVRVKPNGFPYANDPAPTDPGVAIYFTRDGKSYAMACDAYDSVRANVRGLALCIDALRALERHGSSTLMERAFRGFVALPANAGGASWCDVLGVRPDATIEDVRSAYRAKALVAHPDKEGGSESAMSALSVAMEDAERALSVPS